MEKYIRSVLYCSNGEGILLHSYTVVCTAKLQAEEVKADLDKVIQNRDEGPGLPPSEPPFDIR